MSRSSFRYCVALILTLFAVSPSRAQKSGTGGSGTTGSGSSGSSGSNSTGSSTTTQPVGSVNTNPGQQPGVNQNQPQFRSPLYVNGRILMDNGQPVPESVSVALGCGIRPLQVIHTDLKGYFQFTLGAGPQGNMDFSASNDSSMPASIGGIQSLSNGLAGVGSSQSMLTGCEVEVTVSGYQPLTKTITETADITGIDVGTLRLSRIAGVEGSSISVTSLLVPNGARKEFQKGEKDVQGKHLDSAAQHLEKAVSEYDKYAAAWNDLGSIYATDHETEKSRADFEKSIAADPHYLPPYLGLAELELQNQEYEQAVQTAGKALDLDPSIGAANFIQAAANLKLNLLDAADKSAQMAEKEPHQNMPDLHAMHADILLRKQDYPDAAAQMRAYLKEFPQGRFADQMKKDLQQIEQSTGATSAKNSASPQIAP